MYLSPAEEFRRTVGATGVGVVLLVMVAFFSKSVFSRGWIALTWGTALLLEMAVRRTWRLYQHRRKLDGRLAMRTLIIGSTGEAIRLAKALAEPGSGFLPLGYVQPHGATEAGDTLPVLGGIASARTADDRPALFLGDELADGGAVGVRLARPHAARERLDDVGERVPVLAHEREDLGRGDPLRRRVLGDGAFHGGDLARHRVRAHPEPVATLVAALEHEPRPGAVLALQPGLVEERRLGHAAGVRDGGLDERLHAPPPHRPGHDRAHLDEHGRGLAGHEGGDRARLAGIAGKVLEEVADAVEPERCRRFGGAGRLDLQRLGQPRRARVANRRVGEGGRVELVGGGEGEG